MKKLTKKRKTELVKQYPDGEAIGKAIVEDYLNLERRSLGVLHDSSSALSNDEIAFLLSTIQAEEDIQAYNRRVEFRDAIYLLANMVSCFDNIFFCGYFRALGLIQPTETALDALRRAPNLLDDFSFKGKALNMLIQLGGELLPSWNIVKNGLRGLYIYDSILGTIGEIQNFDFSVIRPDMENYTNGFLNLQNDAKHFLSTVENFTAATKGKRRKLSVSRKVTKAVTEVIDSDIEELKPSEEAQKVLLTLPKDLKINITALHVLIKSLKRQG